MIESDILFILLEFAYLIIFFTFEFTDFKLLIGIAYLFAGFKYSISAITSSDMIAYNEIYNTISSFGAESIYNQEVSFLNLLYIAKILHIPLTLFHALEVIIFLLSVNFLCRAFVSKNRAATITLLFGFFPVGGELCLYLLRQLLSTSLVFTSMGLLFRDKSIKSILVFSSSILFHSSAIIYTPLFITKLIKNNTLKILLISLAYGVYIYLISNIELGGQIISSLTGEASLYQSKYEIYTSVFSQAEGWRESNIGAITAVMLLYFVALATWKINTIRKSKLWLYYNFTFIFTAFYLVLNVLKFFWISSRFNFISDILLFTSNIFLSIELFPRNNEKIIFATIAAALFWVSIIVIIRGYEVSGIFRI